VGAIGEAVGSPNMALVTAEKPDQVPSFTLYEKSRSIAGDELSEPPKVKVGLLSLLELLGPGASNCVSGGRLVQPEREGLLRQLGIGHDVPGEEVR
jgi:hypothetical protein